LEYNTIITEWAK